MWRTKKGKGMGMGRKGKEALEDEGGNKIRQAVQWQIRKTIRKKEGYKCFDATNIINKITNLFCWLFACCFDHILITTWNK